MFRNSKRLGLAFVASLVLVGTAASAARAANEFTASQYPATIEGTQVKGKNVEIDFPAVKVTCAKATFKGLIAASTGEWTQELWAALDCTAVINGVKMAVDIKMNGCDWQAKNVMLKKEKTLKCEAGKDVQIMVWESEAAKKEGKTLCNFHLAAQSELAAVEYENVAGSPEDVLAKENLTGIKYTTTGSAIVCGSSGSSAEFVAESTLTAKNGKGEAIGFMVG